MKKGIFLVLVIALCFSMVIGMPPILTGSAKAAEALPKRVTMATLSMGTLYYALASGLAKVASDNSPMTVVVMPTSGTQAYYPFIHQTGRPELGLGDFHSIWQAYTGKIAPEPVPKGFPDKRPYPQCNQLRNLMSGSPFFVSFLVRDDSGITRVEQLKGKRVAWGWSAFMPNINITLALLYNGGLTLDDIKPVSIAEVVSGVRALADGRIDATSCAIGMGATSEADALVGVRFLLLSNDPKDVQAALSARPGVTFLPLPPGPAGIKKKTMLMATPMNVLASTHLADNVAYTLVKTWWENYTQWQSIHPMLKAWTTKLFVSKISTIPYHEGAIKFYKEKGVWGPEMDQVQKKLLKGQ